MNTIYMTQWQGQTLGRELRQAAGGAGRLTGPCRRDAASLRAGEDKVIDLAAWKAENLVEPDGPETADGPESGLGQYEGRELLRRRRRKDRSALVLAELTATLAAAGVMAAMILRVLAF